MADIKKKILEKVISAFGKKGSKKEFPLAEVILIVSVKAEREFIPIEERDCGHKFDRRVMSSSPIAIEDPPCRGSTVCYTCRKPTVLCVEW
ncbi:hypothetical protein TNCV_3959811 [Trichonephila clavipes]|nr:hypothetical protein TNCV_3959811 [Trichonephila clavipes]